MNKIYDKILLVLLMGSIWGAFELFGAEMLKALDVPHKSPFLFSFAIMILITSKRLNDFPGSAVFISAIALFYKSFSPDFHVCWATQTIAIMANGIVFELGYRLFKNRIELGIVWRSLGALVIGYTAYITLLSFNAVFRPEAFAACGGIQGMFDYVSTSGTYAAILSILTLNLGYLFGERIKYLINSPKPDVIPAVIKIFGLLILSIVWIARFIY